MRTFTIGDIHGRFEALQEVLKKSNFNYEKDKLIVLGDIVDGGEQTYEVVEELLKIKNVVFIEGNHDTFFKNHMSSGWMGNIWTSQGGWNTIKSYMKNVGNFIYYPTTHQEFFNNTKLYHIENNMIFVHGGFNPMIPMKSQKRMDLLWDRDLIKTAKKKPIYFNDIYPIKKNIFWDKVFVGHTTTEIINDDTLPLKFNNLWALDTGAGWSGKLTIMNVNTEEYWQSEKQLPCRTSNN